MNKKWDDFAKGNRGTNCRKTGSGNPCESEGFAKDVHWDYTNKALIGFQDFIYEAFKEVIRVLKPGGHALVWAIPRTAHHTAMGLERAGFEVRDKIFYASSKDDKLDEFINSLNEEQKKLFSILIDEASVLHCFGTGFPKALDIGKAVDELQKNEREIIGEKRGQGNIPNDRGNWGLKPNTPVIVTKGNSLYEGWKSALKPAIEEWILIRKPISEKTIAENILKWGVGGINIDACRIPHNELEWHTKRNKRCDDITCSNKTCGFNSEKTTLASANQKGRFPSHFIHDGSQQVLDFFPKTGKSSGGKSGHTGAYSGGYKQEYYNNEKPGYSDKGSAARFFYCAKPSKFERNLGCENLEEKEWGKDSLSAGIDRRNCSNENKSKLTKYKPKNNHPTVKSLELMRYLCKLITPPKGTVLDCFMGSGSTGLACKIEGFNFIGVEKEKDYFDIAKARINYKGYKY
jgi:site-specific DNA-methyltransferase (adenine-specific)